MSCMEIGDAYPFETAGIGCFFILFTITATYFLIVGVRAAWLFVDLTL